MLGQDWRSVQQCVCPDAFLPSGLGRTRYAQQGPGPYGYQVGEYHDELRCGKVPQRIGLNWNELKGTRAFKPLFYVHLGERMA